jgi:hypothetical protein
MKHVLYPQPGYPFTLGISVEYALSESGLQVRTTLERFGPLGIWRSVAPYRVRLVDGARYLPRRSTSTALELEGASCAVVFAGAAEHRCIVIHQSTRGGHFLAARVLTAVSETLAMVDGRRCAWWRLTAARARRRSRWRKTRVSRRVPRDVRDAVAVDVPTRVLQCFARSG